MRLLEKLGRKRVIYDREDNEPYLVRYYLLLRERRWFPFNIFIHKFLKSDPSELHDHPWPFISVILKGGYFEWTYEYDDEGNELPPKREWITAGRIRFARANKFHRIELMEGVDAWTLFIPGPQIKPWGFKVKGKWIENSKYLGLKKRGKL